MMLIHREVIKGNIKSYECIGYVHSTFVVREGMIIQFYDKDGKKYQSRIIDIGIDCITDEHDDYTMIIV